MVLGTFNCMFLAKPRKPTNKVVTVPAPIGGLNARDSLAAMPEIDAVIMRNVWPQPYGCTVRKGSIEQATGFGDSVDSLATWSSVDGSSKLFAWSGTDMYDITTAGPIGAAIVSTLTNAVWHSTRISTSAGSFMLAANGADDMIGYRAAGVYRIVAGDGIVADTWAGLDPADAVQLTVHQGRLWAVEVNSPRGWYLPVGAIQGTLVSFDFGPLFVHGGYLLYLTTWTIDDGNGAEDHLVAMSSEGDVVVYGGTDPSDSTLWSLVGVYYAGAPVSGRNSFTKIGGDLAFITQRGVVSLTNLLASTKVNEAHTVFKSDKIQLLIAYATETYSDLPGWQLQYAAPYNMLIVNVPTTDPAGSFQFAANELMPTEPWTLFTGWDARCWITSNNLLYFGDNTGTVYKAWQNAKDEIAYDGSTSGTEIIWEIQQAYSYLGAFSVQKQVGMYRPNFITAGDISYNSRIDYDFVAEDIIVADAPSGITTSLWGTAIWGSSFWAGATSTDRNWRQARGIGTAAALRMSGQAGVDLIWISTDYSYKVGTLL